jgi:hypothetical protein
VVNYRSTREDIDRMLTAVRTIGSELLSQRTEKSNRGGR